MIRVPILSKIIAPTGITESFRKFLRNERNGEENVDHKSFLYHMCAVWVGLAVSAAKVGLWFLHIIEWQCSTAGFFLEKKVTKRYSKPERCGFLPLFEGKCSKIIRF